MATSGTYDDLTPNTLKIFIDAFERAGVINSELTPLQINSAMRSAEWIMQSWVNKGLNLWTVKQGMLALRTGQTAYTLPEGGIRILEATLRTSNRQLGGTPFSSAGGTAAFAFDGNPNTACTQTAPDGYISYNFGSATYAISLVGIQSNVTRDYTLVGEYSFDNATWTNAITIPEQTYDQSIISWFVVPVPVAANYFRIREIGGATLNVQELYFNTTIQDLLITPFSRLEYVSQIQKQQPGRPTNYYVDRQISPIIYIWPAPTAQYNNLYYTFTRHMEDVGTLRNTIQVPARFMMAFIVALSYDLALKAPQFDLQRAMHLGALAQQLYKEAADEDREYVPTRIYPVYMGWSKE